MLTRTTEPRVCRACTRIIGKGTVISLVKGKHPYHTSCSPLPDDASYRHPRDATPQTNPAVAADEAQDNPTLGDYSVLIAAGSLPILALLWAMTPDNPYDYFLFLRFVVFFGAIPFFGFFHGRKRYILRTIFIFIIVLYNPLAPIHLNRDIWIILNAITIAFFAYGLFSILVALRNPNRP